MTIDKIKTLIVADTTVDPLVTYLKQTDIQPAVDAVCAPYNTIVQVLSDRTGFDKDQYDALLIWSTPERIISSLADLYSENAWDLEQILAEVDMIADLIVRASESIGMVVMLTWCLPPHFRWNQSLRMKHRHGVANILMHMNLRLAEKLDHARNVVLLDLDYILSNIEGAAFDPRLYALGKINYSRDVFVAVSREFKAVWRGCHGLSRKLVITDLDNTLWGGIVGDDGIENLKLGGIDPLGESFVLFQKGLKQLRNRGVLLAICSKNEESVAMQVLETHPEMVLRKEDFASMRINWQDKAVNIGEIVNELNLGHQSVVFLDDMKQERERVKSAYPEILVPDLPESPIEYPPFLYALDCFETNVITLEDRKRTDYYRQDSERRTAEKQATSLDDWLRSLQIKVVEGPVTAESMTRVVQLFNKTNQFNARTRRLTAEELDQWLQDANHYLRVYQVMDRYGDQGITGIISAEARGTDAEIVDFILSCRVFGKQIEELMLSRMLTFLGELQIESVTVPVFETGKNKPIRSFLEKKYKSGQAPLIDPATVVLPDFIEITARTEG